jgi:SAM-dependent methyltransferase
MKQPIDLSKLDRVEPVSRLFGFDRGKPIDRFYVEAFLEAHTDDIHGDVLEIEDAAYTIKYGGSKVTKSDILHINNENQQATIIADLTQTDNIPDNSFDCIIFTQTLQFIYDTNAVIRNLHRILKPNGVVLATVGGISQISRYDMDRWGDYWRFTDLSAKRLFLSAFLPENVQVESHGNVLIATAFLQGLAIEDIPVDKFEYNDKDYQVTITIRAVKE